MTASPTESGHRGPSRRWRDGKLQVIDSGLQMRELFGQEDERAVMSKVLLLDHGQVVLALDDELLIFAAPGSEHWKPGPGPAPTATGTVALSVGKIEADLSSDVLDPS